MPIPKVSIIMVTWNSQHYIYNALESISSQTFKDFSVLIIDNHSIDGTLELIKKDFPQCYVIKNSKNAGYGKGNNQGMKLSRSEYVLIMNPDIILDKNFLSNIIIFADNHKQGGSFCGKIFKQQNKNIDSLEKNNIIDAAGFVMKKNRNAINRGEGKEDSAEFQNNIKVFGAPGCLALYRKAALLDTESMNEFFDEDFFAYKEDVDLAWRLNIYGWESWYVPEAIAFHKRSFPATGNRNIFKNIIARKKIPKKLRYLSLRNQYLMILKNDAIINIFAHGFHISLRALYYFLLMICAEPFLLKIFIDIPKLFLTYMRKRKIIMAHTKIPIREMRKWFL